MKVIDVYDQYFGAECVYNERPRHAADVKLTATSDAGRITYEVSVSFFPHDDEEDFAVSYDAYAAATVCDAPGRRSKKREAELLESFREKANELAASLEGQIFWENPLREARLG